MKNGNKQKISEYFHWWWQVETMGLAGGTLQMTN